MKNSLFNFKDDEEREMFFIAIPVILFFGLLGYWLTTGQSTPDVIVADTSAQMIDSDADGVPDNTDQCVNRSGTIANAGCPASIAYADRDHDNDGIRNGIDSCPETKGDAANNGCRAALTASATSATTGIAAATAVVAPTATASVANNLTIADADQDGVADSIDRCPGISGTESDLGCPPDSDNDGVLGAADLCPDEAGPAIDNGCAADADGDGFSGDDDQCPMTPGDVNGCPADSDGDGVSDLVDACPEQSGTAATNGCPEDSDGDGVTNAEDRCPDTAGVVSNEGCAAETMTGSPDTSTGVITGNTGDETTIDVNGSSTTVVDVDSDGDGVADSNDQCATEFGLASNNGCPAPLSTASVIDSDGDSVPDSTDACPTIAGTVAAMGCPTDTDGDSLADSDDLCPTVAGPIEWRGCPDSPNAEPSSISTQDQQILDTALAQVEFNSSSATLTAKSKEILQQVAELLTRYPNARLEIRGHTDSSGRDTANMKLSMERARSTANYIAQQGIDVTRLIAYGYGESQPIASNDTAAGKRTNRRVEFELKF